MKEVLFVAAGTRGAKLLGGQFQPFVLIRDKFCVEHVMDAAIDAATIDTIYVWGDKVRLTTVLENACKKAAKRGVEVWIVQEKSNFIDSFLFAYLLFLHHRFGRLAPEVFEGEFMDSFRWDLLSECGQEESMAGLSVNLLLSDTPLISAHEIDRLIVGKNPDADLIFGRTVKSAIDAVLSGIPEPFCYDRAVKNYYNYLVQGESLDLIVNSFMAGKPLRVPRYIWNFAGHLFQNRTIIEGGRFNLTKIKNNVVFFRSFFAKNNFSDAEKAAIAKKNYYQRLKAFSFLLRAYFVVIKNKNAAAKFRDLAVLEEKIRILTHCKIEYQIGDSFGPALDIDTVYEIEYIERFFDQLQDVK